MPKIWYLLSENADVEIEDIYWILRMMTGPVSTL